jgi:hypothetical protein
MNVAIAADGQSYVHPEAHNVITIGPWSEWKTWENGETDLPVRFKDKRHTLDLTY